MIAISLSMDSLAVSISDGLFIKKLRIKHIFSIALSLSVFQGLMPILGWFLGGSIEQYIQDVDHWIAFILLGIIGLKMLYEGFTFTDNSKITHLNTGILILQSIATSIDALIVGISFALLNWSIFIPAIIISITTFIFSITGLKIGKYLGNKIGVIATIIGGIVLIGIGTKILIEHLYFQ